MAPAAQVPTAPVVSRVSSARAEIASQQGLEKHRECERRWHPPSAKDNLPVEDAAYRGKGKKSHVAVSAVVAQGEVSPARKPKAKKKKQEKRNVSDTATCSSGSDSGVYQCAASSFMQPVPIQLPGPRADKDQGRSGRDMQVSQRQSSPRNGRDRAVLQGRCYGCNREGHRISECSGSDRGQTGRAQGNSICFRCRQPGHYASSCPLG
ncbi:uncharacterized protein LOC131675060 [Phymastichus coffea]|uniref:uncharacterized protein LOC131675060 n=1 Tax=Phymastichus coffea TaxID=108790 RepID=UPI00273B50B6|nr:uncharacterized protein LOC131675060 [Phymastichus coffea]